MKIKKAVDDDDMLAICLGKTGISESDWDHIIEDSIQRLIDSRLCSYM